MTQGTSHHSKCNIRTAWEASFDVFQTQEDFLNVSLFEESVLSGSYVAFSSQEDFEDQMLHLALNAYSAGEVTGEQISFAQNVALEANCEQDVTEFAIHVRMGTSIDYNPWESGFSLDDFNRIIENDEKVLTSDESILTVVCHPEDKTEAPIKSQILKVVHHTRETPGFKDVMLSLGQDDILAEDCDLQALEAAEHALPDGSRIGTISALSKSDEGALLNTVLRTFSL